ncbi:UNVERIFIED_CONTAM: hypothetical protein Sindi_2674500 [Sesamum indicum]
MPQFNGVAERRNRTMLEMVRSTMSFIELSYSVWGYALETAAKLLNMAPSKTVPQTPYEIRHGKLASYNNLRVWGSSAHVKKLVGDKLDSRSNLCSRRNVVLLEETSDIPQHNEGTSFEPIIPADSVPALRRSTKESRMPNMYGFMGLSSQLKNDLKIYREAMFDIDSEKWLKAYEIRNGHDGFKSVWTLVDPPKGVKPVGCKWVYKR